MDAKHWALIGVLDDVVATKNPFLMTPVAAYEGMHAKQGDKLPTTVAAAGALFGSAGATSLLARTLTMAVPGMPMMAGVILGAAALAKPTDQFYRGLRKGLREIQSLDRTVRRLETGGGYKDNETAKALRLAAMRDMGSVFQHARSYLGREAEYLHR